MMASKGGLERKASERADKRTIQVAVRVRPMNSSEREEKAVRAVKVEGHRVTVKNPSSIGTEKDKTFGNFDKVYGPNSKQVDVYTELVAPLLGEVLQGYNGTIFAYGQTGTGKTFTMEGERAETTEPWNTNTNVGIIPRTLQHLFDILESKQGSEFSVRVSYIELYNEEVFDLLGPLDPNSCKRKLYEDPHNKGSVVVQGMEEVVVRNRDQVYDILRRGAEKRKTAETLLNAHSSRSHAVFTISVHVREQCIDGREMIKQGKLNLVDLAGSENIGRSGAVKQRAKEAGTINQSLLTLGRVINSLVEHRSHIPYRESKLTRLLQDSLGGKTITTIIATLSPASTNLEETLSTLDYAERAKNIKNTPAANQKLTQIGLIKEYTDEIDRLRKDLAAARNKDGIFIANENYEAMQTRIERQLAEIDEKEERLETINNEMEKRMEDIKIMNDKWKRTWRKKDRLQEKLDEKRDQHRQTQESLLLSERELEKSQYVLQAHRQAEYKLRDTAIQLASVSEQATSEVYSLQSKVERVDAVLDDNRAHVGRCREQLNEHVEQLTRSNDDCDRDMQHIISQAVNNIESLCGGYRECISRVVGAVGDMGEEGSVQLEAMHNTYTTAIQHNVGQLNNIQQVVQATKESRVTDVAAMEHQFSSEFATVCALFHEVCGIFGKTMNSVKSQVTKMGDASQQNLHVQLEMLKAAHDIQMKEYKLRLEQANSRAASLEQLYAETQQVMQQTQKVMAHIAALKESEGQLPQAIEKSHAKEISDNEKQAVALQNNDEAERECRSELVSTCEQTESSARAIVVDFDKKAEQLCAQHTSQTQSLVQELESGCKVVCKYVQKEEDIVTHLLEDMDVARHSLDQTHTHTVEHIRQQKHAYDLQLCESEKQLTSSVDASLEKWKGVTNYVNEWTDTHRTAVGALTSGWKRVNKTGVTPGRHKFAYSKEIVPVPDEGDLLDQFEQENSPLDLDINASGLDESSFMMSPPPPATPKSESTAATSDSSNTTPTRPLAQRN